MTLVYKKIITFKLILIDTSMHYLNKNKNKHMHIIPLKIIKLY